MMINGTQSHGSRMAESEATQPSYDVMFKRGVGETTKRLTEATTDQ